MPILPWRAHQTTGTTGTGTLTLNAAATSRRSFQAAYGVSAVQVKYVIAGTSFYEMGYGSFDGGTPGTLTRPSGNIVASSNAGSLVSLPAGTADVYAWIDPGERQIVTGTGAITLALADLGNGVVWSGTTAQTVALPAVANAPAGLGFQFRNAGTANLTLDPNASETINGALILVLTPGQAVEVLKVGTAWVAFYEATRMISEIVWLPLTTPPPRCLWANGQNVSRTTYAALFAALGTIFGVGDGTTTFGLPDLRGRTLFGKDDMGGTAAARLTSAGSGVDGLTLGAVGGSQFLHGHTHTATDSGHNHSITDPGHAHTSNASQTPVSSPGVGIAGSGTGWSFNGATITSATTGISIATGTANVTNATTGSGTSQNMPPSMVMNAFIYAGA